MKQKKSIVGSTVWLLFTIIVAGAIWQIVYTMITVIPEASWGRKGLILGCMLIVAAGALMLIRMMALYVQKKFVIIGKKAVVLDLIAISLLIVTAVFSRLYDIDTIDLSQSENIYYELAAVGTDKLVFHTTNHAAIIYAYLLSFLLTVFGNKVSICIYFQILLQCCTLLFCYFAIRNISGKMVAITASMILTLYPSYIKSILPLVPENLLICIFMIGFWMISLLWKYLNEKQTTNIIDGVIFFMAGLSTAAMIYTDMIGVVLLIMSVGGIFICHKNTDNSIKKSMLRIVYYLLGSVGGAVLLFEIEAVICRESFLQIMKQYVAPWLTVTLYYVSIFPSVILEISIIIILISAVWCVRYWQADQDENIMYLLMLISVVCINLFFLTSIDYHMLIIFAWIFIASASLKSICSKYGKGSEIGAGIILLSDLIEEKPASQIGDKSEMDVKENNKNVEELKDKPKPNLIPNPLPLPKQHVKKEMDYAFEPDENRMHYDIEVIRENDDFDI